MDVERMPFLKAIHASYGASYLSGRRTRSFLTAVAVLFVSISFLLLLTPHRRSRASNVKVAWSQSQTTTIPKEPYLQDATQAGLLVSAPHRALDLIDAFENFTRTEKCYIDSLELHEPFEPLCSTRLQLLDALSNGARAALDTPYNPHGCDMRWYTTAELCAILSRFDRVIIMGDSMMRNLVTAMHTILRTDLIDGPRKKWIDDPAGFDCSCTSGFASAKCIFNNAFSSSEIWANDAESMSCPQHDSALLEYTAQTTYPLLDNVPGVQDLLPSQPPLKPYAFLFGHGIWNDCNLTATQLWTEQIHAAIEQKNPWYAERPSSFHRLFITPNAPGANKPAKHLALQGPEAVARFTHGMAPWLAAKGYDHLGLYNLTLRSTSPDGTHAGMRSNLVKAMMVFNWLDKLDFES